MSEKLFELKNIVKTYGKGDGIVHALRNVDFSVEKGESVAIMGKSGSGKSTLLNIIGGLDTPDSGEYVFDGRNLPAKNFTKMSKFRRYNVGFVVQHFALINEYSVYNNIALPVRYTKHSEAEVKAKIEELAEKLEIADKLKKKPTQLSGGQAQRVAIARALIHNPKMILADEPTGALDEATGKSIMEIFTQINKENGTTLSVVTHDKGVADYCGRTVVMKDGNII